MKEEFVFIHIQASGDIDELPIESVGLIYGIWNVLVDGWYLTKEEAIAAGAKPRFGQDGNVVPKTDLWLFTSPLRSMQSLTSAERQMRNLISMRKARDGNGFSHNKPYMTPEGLELRQQKVFYTTWKKFELPDLGCGMEEVAP